MNSKFGICFWLLNKSIPNVLINVSSEEFDKLSPHGKVFDINDDSPHKNYYSISYGVFKCFIIKAAIKLIEDNVLPIGIIVKDKNNSDIVGSISERVWHFKDEKTFYYITVNNKLRSKRYFLEDLIIY